MNNTELVIVFLSDISNLTFQSLDEAYQFYGATKFLDYAFPSFYIPFGTLGLVLNIMSYRILLRKEFYTIQLYTYIRIYVFSSVILNFLQTFYSITMTRLLPSVQNTYLGQAYACFVYTPIHNLLTFYKFGIDLAIIIDRISTLSPRVKKIYKLNAIQILILIFVIVLVVDFPYFFTFVPNRVNFIYKNQSIEYYYTDTSSFARSKIGKIVLYIVYFFRHVVTLISEIILDIISNILLSKHFLNKQKLTKLSRVQSMTVDHSVQNKTAEMSKSVSLSGHATLQNQNNSLKNTIVTPATNLPLSSMSAENKATVMVTVLILTSLIHQILLLTYFVYYLIAFDSTAILLDFIGNFSSVVRHGSNFLVLYFFNLNFRRIFLKMIQF
jgi:hypothetical protein